MEVTTLAELVTEEKLALEREELSMRRLLLERANLADAIELEWYENRVPELTKGNVRAIARSDVSASEQRSDTNSAPRRNDV
jgi:hypothetical protein